ncbi:MAG: TetR/AcrR family transcriptional regulator [Victivallaceae bacterium]|nr:TetR/AcrR family transcriptional regulator [Victivallaceae bacterium]
MAKLSEKMKALVSENMRHVILETSERIIIRDGLDNLTMKQLAEEAEISAGSIYNYFQNKEEIVSGIMDRAFERLLDSLEAIAGRPLPAADKLRAMAVFMFGDFPQVRKLHEALMHRLPPPDRKNLRNRHRRLLDILTGTIRQGIEAGEFSVCEPVLAASAFLGIIRELQFDPGEMFSGLEPELLAEKAAGIYLSGIKCGAEP